MDASFNIPCMYIRRNFHCSINYSLDNLIKVMRFYQ